MVVLGPNNARLSNITRECRSSVKEDGVENVTNIKSNNKAGRGGRFPAARYTNHDRKIGPAHHALGASMWQDDGPRVTKAIPPIKTNIQKTRPFNKSWQWLWQSNSPSSSKEYPGTSSRAASPSGASNTSRPISATTPPLISLRPTFPDGSSRAVSSSQFVQEGSSRAPSSASPFQQNNSPSPSVHRSCSSRCPAYPESPPREKDGDQNSNTAYPESPRQESVIPSLEDYKNNLQSNATSMPIRWPLDGYLPSTNNSHLSSTPAASTKMVTPALSFLRSSGSSLSVTTSSSRSVSPSHHSSGRFKNVYSADLSAPIPQLAAALDPNPFVPGVGHRWCDVTNFNSISSTSQSFARSVDSNVSSLPLYHQYQQQLQKNNPISMDSLSGRASRDLRSETSSYHLSVPSDRSLAEGKSDFGIRSNQSLNVSEQRDVSSLPEPNDSTSLASTDSIGPLSGEEHKVTAAPQVSLSPAPSLSRAREIQRSTEAHETEPSSVHDTVQNTVKVEAQPKDPPDGLEAAPVVGTESVIKSNSSHPVRLSSFSSRAPSSHASIEATEAVPPSYPSQCPPFPHGRIEMVVSPALPISYPPQSPISPNEMMREQIVLQGQMRQQQEQLASHHHHHMSELRRLHTAPQIPLRHHGTSRFMTDGRRDFHKGAVRQSTPSRSPVIFHRTIQPDRPENGYVWTGRSHRSLSPQQTMYQRNPHHVKQIDGSAQMLRSHRSLSPQNNRVKLWTPPMTEATWCVTPHQFSPFVSPPSSVSGMSGYPSSTRSKSVSPRWLAAPKLPFPALAEYMSRVKSRSPDKKHRCKKHNDSEQQKEKMPEKKEEHRKRCKRKYQQLWNNKPTLTSPPSSPTPSAFSVLKSRPASPNRVKIITPRSPSPLEALFSKAVAASPKCSPVEPTKTAEPVTSDSPVLVDEKARSENEINPARSLASVSTAPSTFPNTHSDTDGHLPLSSASPVPSSLPCHSEVDVSVPEQFAGYGSRGPRLEWHDGPGTRAAESPPPVPESESLLPAPLSHLSMFPGRQSSFSYTGQQDAQNHSKLSLSIPEQVQHLSTSGYEQTRQQTNPQVAVSALEKLQRIAASAYEHRHDAHFSRPNQRGSPSEELEFLPSDPRSITNVPQNDGTMVLESLQDAQHEIRTYSKKDSHLYSLDGEAELSSQTLLHDITYETSAYSNKDSYTRTRDRVAEVSSHSSNHASFHDNSIAELESTILAVHAHFDNTGDISSGSSNHHQYDKNGAELGSTYSGTQSTPKKDTYYHRSLSTHHEQGRNEISSPLTEFPPEQYNEQRGWSVSSSSSSHPISQELSSLEYSEGRQSHRNDGHQVSPTQSLLSLRDHCNNNRLKQNQCEQQSTSQLQERLPAFCITENGEMQSQPVTSSQLEGWASNLRNNVYDNGFTENHKGLIGLHGDDEKNGLYTPPPPAPELTPPPAFLSESIMPFGMHPKPKPSSDSGSSYATSDRIKEVTALRKYASMSDVELRKELERITGFDIDENYSRADMLTVLQKHTQLREDSDRKSGPSDVELPENARNQFQWADVNNRGLIDFSSTLQGLRHLHYCQCEGPFPPAVETHFHRLDINQSGFVTINEFARLYQLIAPENQTRKFENSSHSRKHVMITEPKPLGPRHFSSGDEDIFYISKESLSVPTNFARMEFRLLQKLPIHMHLAPFHIAESETDFILTRQRYIDLGFWLQKGHHEPETIAVRVMKQVLDAVSFLHSRRLVHGAINLDNIKVEFENPVWIRLADPMVEALGILSSAQDDKRATGLLGYSMFIGEWAVEEHEKLLLHLRQEGVHALAYQFLYSLLMKTENIETAKNHEIFKYVEDGGLLDLPHLLPVRWQDLSVKIQNYRNCIRAIAWDLPLPLPAMEYLQLQRETLIEVRNCMPDSTNSFIKMIELAYTQKIHEIDAILHFPHELTPDLLHTAERMAEVTEDEEVSDVRAYFLGPYGRFSHSSNTSNKTKTHSKDSVQGLGILRKSDVSASNSVYMTNNVNMDNIITAQTPETPLEPNQRSPIVQGWVVPDHDLSFSSNIPLPTAHVTSVARYDSWKAPDPPPSPPFSRFISQDDPPPGPPPMMSVPYHMRP